MTTDDEPILPDEQDARRAALAEQPGLAVIAWFIGLVVGCVMLPLGFSAVVHVVAEAWLGYGGSVLVTAIGLILGIAAAFVAFVVLNWLRTTPRWRWSYALVVVLVAIGLGAIGLANTLGGP